MSDKIAFVADVHIGNHARMGGVYSAGLNDRCRGIAEVLTVSVDRALDAGCCAFVVLGDLFDVSNPTPQVVAATQNALQATGHMVGQLWLLVGNHDQESYAPGDHALAPLQAHGRIVERPTCVRLKDTDLLLVPFQKGNARDWLPGAVAEAAALAGNPAKRKRCLGLHLGIIDDDTPPFLKDAEDAVPASMLHSLQQQHSISAVIAGNWHKYKYYGNEVVQVGALVPNGFSDNGLDGYGSLVMWDSKSNQHSRVEVEGPRYISTSASPEKVARMLQKANVASSFARVRLSTEADNISKSQEALAKLNLAAFEVVPDKQTSIAAARDAAQQARTALDVDSSVAGFIDAMPLAEGVDRSEVLRRVQGFLKESNRG